MTLSFLKLPLRWLLLLFFAARVQAGLVGQWTFTTDATEATAHFAPGTLANGATVSNGRLNLNTAAGQFFKSGPYTGAPLAAFYIEAADAGSLPATSRFPADAPVREALVRWGETNEPGAFASYNMWMTKATFDRWSARMKMSNDPCDVTLAYRGDRVIYNAGACYAGSPFHALGKFSPGTYDTPTGHWCDYDMTFPKDDLLLGVDETKLSWPGNTADDSTGQRDQAGYWTAEQLGLPFCPRHYVHLFVNGVRRAAIFEDCVQPGKDMLDVFFDGDADGDLHKVQLWFEYTPAVASNYTFSDARMENYFTTGGARKCERYRVTWPKRAAGPALNDFTELYALFDAVTTSATGDAYTAAIEAKIDVEQWMRVVAYEHVIENVDSFGNSSLSQNMYAYKPPGGRWVLIPWDVDYSYAGGTTGDLFLINDAMLARIAAHPPFRRALWRAYRDAASGPLLASNFDALVDSKYTGLLANNASVASPAGLKSNAAGRRTYILNQLNSVAAAFTANGPSTSNSATITLSGTAPVEVKTIEVNGLALATNWTSVLLTAPDGTLIDSVTFGAQTTDISEGRAPSGDATITVLTSPTPRATNAPAAPPPTITSTTRTANSFSFTFTTLQSFSYRAEYSDDLLTWTPLGAVIPGNGGQRTATDPAPNPVKRFYRVKRTP